MGYGLWVMGYGLWVGIRVRVGIVLAHWGEKVYMYMYMRFTFGEAQGASERWPGSHFPTQLPRSRFCEGGSRV